MKNKKLTRVVAFYKFTKYPTVSLIKTYFLDEPIILRYQSKNHDYLLSFSFKSWSQLFLPFTLKHAWFTIEHLFYKTFISVRNGRIPTRSVRKIVRPRLDNREKEKKKIWRKTWQRHENRPHFRGNLTLSFKSLKLKTDYHRRARDTRIYVTTSEQTMLLQDFLETRILMGWINIVTS